MSQSIHFSLFCNLAGYPRQEGVDDKLHGLNHPQPQPEAHGAPHLREEGGQAELQEVSLCDQHLTRDGKKKGRKVLRVMCFMKIFGFRVCCGAGQGTVGDLGAVKQVKIIHPRKVT